MEVDIPIKGKGATLHGGDNFSSLPEECISAIIAFTTPTDACRLALVSKLFQSASESDVVWERFLPSDCYLIAARSDGGESALAEFNTKKRLYMHLANRFLLFDGGTKSFSLHKSSGKKCWMFAARSLIIQYSNSALCWLWTYIPESRFPEVAQLLCVRRSLIGFDFHTSILSPETRYAAYLVFKMTENAYGLNNDYLANVFSRGGKFNAELRIVYLSVESEQMQVGKPPTSLLKSLMSLNTNSAKLSVVCVHQYPKLRTDGWKEVKIGEFLTSPGEEVGVCLFLHMCDGNWKSGLIVEGIEVRPAGRKDQDPEL